MAGFVPEARPAWSLASFVARRSRRSTLLFASLLFPPLMLSAVGWATYSMNMKHSATGKRNSTCVASRTRSAKRRTFSSIGNVSSIGRFHGQQQLVCHVFGWLNPSELLQVALVSTTWCKAANQTALLLLDKVPTKHSVSDDWRERLEMRLQEQQSPQQRALFENQQQQQHYRYPSRCLWKVAQVLHLNQFNRPASFWYHPDVVGLPKAPGPGAIAMLREEGSLLILDTKMGQWSQINVRTGEVSRNGNVENETVSGRGWQSGCLLCCNDYLVYWHSGPIDFFFSVWRLLSNEEPQFLHCTELPYRDDLFFPNTGIEEFSMDAEIQNGEFVVNCKNAEERENADGFAVNVRDDFKLDGPLMARFGLTKESTDFDAIYAQDTFDLETGASTNEISYGLEFRDTIGYGGGLSDFLHSNETTVWLQHAHSRADNTTLALVHEVDKLMPEQPVVRVLRTETNGSPKVYTSKEELITYFEHGGLLQTFLL